ncbi:MAG TPA: mechanosensitive ion channel domain-containing protein [Lysobacter sp.]|nr:mechanosensitive ion channel domain-containing protein [Lysobacter sp.]
MDVRGLLAPLRASNVLNYLESRALDLLGALLILVVGLWLSRRLLRAFDATLTRANVEPTLRGFLRNLAHPALLIVVFVAALSAAGVPTTSVLAVLGAAGLAVGLALKDSLSNIASGVMLIVLRPFRAGDYVQAAGVEGTVEHVRVFQTHLRMADNRAVILPNSMITASPITNFTANAIRRADVTVGVGYDDDLRRARELLLAIAREHPRVLAEPEAKVLVTALAESSVTLELRAWVPTAEFIDVRSDLVEAVRTRLIDNGLHIPYPQRDLHVYHHDADGQPIARLLASTADDGDGDGGPLANPPVVR